MPLSVDVAPARLRSAKPWLRELMVIIPVYMLYSLVRNQFGSAHLALGDAPRDAFNNAIRIIDLEKALGMYHEVTIQGWFLNTWFVTFFNVFYGTAHFAVTIGVLVWLFVRRHHNFRRWRTTLMATTVLALVGFALFPLMPPRLLNVGPDQNRYGGGELAVEQNLPDYGFVDTLRHGKGLWSFDTKGMDNISNQFAAMPSLHIGWSMWCAFVLWHFSRKTVMRIVGALYPILTLVTIVATANHYIIDAVGGGLTLLCGYAVARGIETAIGTRHRSRASNADVSTGL